ncbi:YfgM family protein [Marinicella sp. W31]|uniref:YfgM family protein n=1 Tax=Marinicella sp. W31 TaxID=3023713 RepID=UPI0037563095
MAFEEYDDYEQEQLVKQWLKENWFTIVAGIALGIGAIYGYNYWLGSKEHKKVEAAQQFTEVNQLLELKEHDEAAQMIAKLEADFGNSLYSVEARMELAKKHMEEENLDAAIQQYQLILDGKPERSLAEISRLRLARLKTSVGQYDEANTLLDSVRSEAYASMIDEIRGDILQAKGQSTGAADAYQLALNSGEGYSGKTILEMKLADIRPAE